MADLLELYAQHARDHGRHTRYGDSYAGNESHRHLDHTFRTLVQTGKRCDMLRLNQHPDQSVQCWTAAHTVGIEEEKALQMLDELAHSDDPIISWNA